MKYKVHYSGFYYIEADSAEEAMETSHDDADVPYSEFQNDMAEEIDGFFVDWE